MEKIWLKQYDQQVPHSLEYPARPLGFFLEQAATDFPDNTALQYRGTSITYGQLRDLVERFAAALYSLGVKKGDRIAIQLLNCPQYVIAYYAALKIGAVAVPLNPAYVPREMVFFLENSGAKLLVADEKNQDVIRDYIDRTPTSTLITVDLAASGTALARNLDRLKNQGMKAFSTGKYTVCRMEELFSARRPTPRVEAEPADAAVILYTGGNAGLPIGAVLSHENLVANVLQCRCWNPTLVNSRTETALLALPLSHSYGMTAGMNVGLATASRLVLMPRFNVGEVLDLIDTYGVTYLPGVPAMFDALLKAPGLRKYNLRSIKTCLSGGAPLPLEVQESFERATGGKLNEGYGLTEASPVTHANPYLGTRRAGSIGLPLPDTDVKVIDLQDEDKETAPGGVGELCVKGPQVMKGYYNAPRETAQVLKDGWLHTGDIVHMEEDGFTYIVDRKKDLIISGGYNVYPGEIRAVLAAHPDIERVVVTALRDPNKDESLRAVIHPRKGSSLDKQEVLRFCRENLAGYKIPQSIEIAGNGDAG